MIEQIVLKECNILFDLDAFHRWHIPRTIVEGKYSSSANEDGPPAGENRPVEGIDKQNAVQKITDSLLTNPLWWILEIFPTSYTYQNAKGKWVTTWW
jgi:hypothetical protein